jgi:predicted metal-binding membrane protein
MMMMMMMMMPSARPLELGFGSLFLRARPTDDCSSPCCLLACGWLLPWDF